jgi:hypothetical protein
MAVQTCRCQRLIRPYHFNDLGALNLGHPARLTDGDACDIAPDSSTRRTHYHRPRVL